jgi:hypothetical protein
MARSFVAITLAALFTMTPVTRAEDVIEKSITGSPHLKSINVITFAPQGVLLVGDGAGAQVVAIKTGDTQKQPQLKRAITNIEARLAAPLGAKAEGISIIDMAVNPASGVAYFAVRRQDDKSLAILTVNGAGEVGELELEKVEFAAVQLKAGDAKVTAVTDVAWADSQIVAAGRSNEEFASKIFSIAAPLSHAQKTSSFSAETYHVAHGRWETKAPMSVVIPLKEDGKTYVVGAFSCTPVVKYPIDALQPGAEVKGISMIELGSGNRPLDMFVYEKNGKPYVLASTFRFHHKRRPFGPSPYWTVKFEQSLLVGDKATNEKAVRRLKGNQPATPRIEMVEAFHGVKLMDRLGPAHALVVRETKKGSVFEPLALP